MALCKPSYLRRNYRRRRTKICCVVCVVILLAVPAFYVMIKSQLHFVNNKTIQLDKCPACFGVLENVCLAFAFGELKIWDNYFWRGESNKGVWYGMWIKPQNKLPIVVKALSHRKELDLLDEQICQNTTRSSHCDIQENVWRSFLNPPISFKSSVMQFMECPSNHFASLLEKHLHVSNGIATWFGQLHQKVMVLTSLHLNQELLFLQIFSRRYPAFLPKVYGPCGRTIVVEYVGPTLSSAISKSWLKRVKLSLKLIQLAHTFTRTEDNFALYMYDVIMDNFAVDKEGNVKLVDCEHIVIVDMSPFNNSYGIKAQDLCSPNHFECLTFTSDDLCKGQSQDHNYYAVCRNILAAIGGSKGLLHSLPDNLVNTSLVNYLLQNCVYSKEISREQAINRLEKELYNLLTKSNKK